MNRNEDLSPDEERAFDLIRSNDGILQSDLWKELDMNSRKGSRLARSLVEKELIEREETVANGRTTYRLELTGGSVSEAVEDTSQASKDPSKDTGSDVKEDTDSTEEDRTAEASRIPQELEGMDLSEIEWRTLSLIREHGRLSQSEVGQELDIDGSTVSRIASNLEEKELIRRLGTTQGGEQTFTLLPVTEGIDYSLLMAGDKISPFVNSDEEIDPIGSDEFTEWVLELARKEN